MTWLQVLEARALPRRRCQRTTPAHAVIPPLTEAVVSTAAAASTGTGGVVDGRIDRSLQQPALEQLLSLMDDSQMPIFVSNDEDRYLYESRLAR
jgi:hypothetical protein